MSQHDFVIDNGPGLAVRQDINLAVQALISLSSGPVEPTVKTAGMLWLDTSVSPNGFIRQRNLANTAWISMQVDPLTPGLTIHAATDKPVPITTDEFPMADSAAGGGAWTQVKVTFANLKAAILAIHSAPNKATPVDADEIAIVDSAASFALARLTWANLKAVLFGKFAIGGATIPANMRGDMITANDISLGGVNRLYYNGYYDTVALTVKAIAAGYVAVTAFDPSTGLLAFSRSATSVAAGAAVVNSPVLSFSPSAGVVVANVGPYTFNGSPVLVANLDNLALAAGYALATYANDGVKSSGTYTPTPAAGGNIRAINNGGTFSLASDANASTAYTMVVAITNQAGAGVVTLTGFTKISGDPFTTTVGHIFMCYITKLGGYRTITVEALQ
jgi:hypothetical protein